MKTCMNQTIRRDWSKDQQRRDSKLEKENKEMDG